MKQLLVISFLVSVLAVYGMILSPVAGALTLGRAYDQSNVDEVKNMLPQSIYKWVKGGDWTIPTKKLEFECQWSDKYKALTKRNEGKYDINNDSILVLKAGGREPDYWEGEPFPTIDPNDPKVALKIMANYRAQTASQSSCYHQTTAMWVGKTGLERTASPAGYYMFYNNREFGPIPNPNRYAQQCLIFVREPFDLRGIVTMFFSFNDNRDDVSWAYLPMLRRLRRTPNAARSDPFLGSDATNDDYSGWIGKDASVTWKLLGEGTFLVPFTSEQKHIVKRLPSGAIDVVLCPVTKGFETPAWKGVPWAPVSWVWTPRPCWVVEGVPKDPYYSTGKFVLYLDKTTYTGYYREDCDRSIQYWKNWHFARAHFQTDEKDGPIAFSFNSQLIVDDRRQHATWMTMAKPPDRKEIYNLPLRVCGPQIFTESNVIQMSK